MARDPIGEEATDFFAIMCDSFLRASGGMVDLAGISADTDLKGIRVFADVMQKTARGSRIANIEAAPKAASESASPPEMPFETFPFL
jgi:hypothetical protein